MRIERLRSTITGFTQGAEVETLIDNRGDPYPLEEEHFGLLQELTDGIRHSSRVNGEDHTIGIRYQFGEQTLDAARSLAEFNVNPVGTEENPNSGLRELSERQRKALQLLNHIVREVAESNDAGTISLSMHPLGKRDKETYKALVTPKAIYDLLWEWGWDHTAVIHAAHTSPWTSIDVFKVADALAVMTGSSPVTIALFGNSPIVEGRLNGFKENRQRIWERMMKKSRRSGDRKVSQMPPERPRTLAQYFNWMFGEGTSMTFVTGKDYKTSRNWIVPEYPSFLEYLKGEKWEAYELGNPSRRFSIEPRVTHLIASQWAQFTDARWRFKIEKGVEIPNKWFLEAMKYPNEQRVEELFSEYLTLSCIESRAMGTSLPCEENPEEDPTIAPSALQLGLFRNLDRASQWIDRYDWDLLRRLREKAIRDGFQAEVEGVTALSLAEEMLDICIEGLRDDERWAIKPLVRRVEEGRSEADRAIIVYQKARERGLDEEEATLEVIRVRKYPSY